MKPKYPEGLNDFRVKFFKDGVLTHTYVTERDTLAFVAMTSAVATLRGERRIVEEMQGNILDDWTNNL